MALKITLKPHEKMIIGGAVLCNGPTKTEFIIENTVPILRQRDILGEKEANTPARRIYFVIQLMYVDPVRLAEHHKLYWQLVNDFIQAAPSALAIVDQINEFILSENYYQALKYARRLIDFEQEVIEHVTKCSESLSVG